MHQIFTNKNSPSINPMSFIDAKKNLTNYPETALGSNILFTFKLYIKI